MNKEQRKNNNNTNFVSWDYSLIRTSKLIKSLKNSSVLCRERNQARIKPKHNVAMRPYKQQSPQQLTTTFSNPMKYLSLSNPPNDSIPLQQRSQLFCNICERPGLSNTQCYSKTTNFQKGSSKKRPLYCVNYLQVGNPQIESECQKMGQTTPDTCNQAILATEPLSFQEDCIWYEDDSWEQEDQQSY